MDVYRLLALFVGMTALFSSILVFLVLKMSVKPYRFTFALLQISVILMLIGYVMDVDATTLDGKLFWNNLEYVGFLFVPALALIFSLQYSGYGNALVKRTAMLVIPISLAFLIGVVVNPYHHLVYSDIVIDGNPLRSFDANHGVMYYSLLTFTLIEMVAGIVLFWRRYRYAAVVLRHHYRIMILAFVMPVIFLIAMVPLWYVIPSNLMVLAGILLGSILLFFGAFQFDIFRSVPFTIENIVESSEDAMLILDEHCRPLFLNPMAASLLAKDTADIYKTRITESLSGLHSELFDYCNTSNPVISEVELSPHRYFSLKVHRMKGRHDNTVGYVVVLRNITASKLASERMALALKQVGIMNGISRHDLYNEMMVLNGYLELVERGTPLDEARTARVRNVLRTMDQQISFMREYQDLGKNEPCWQNVSEAFVRAASSLDMGNVSIKNSVDLEVYADPMFEKVLLNLLDNSLKHAGDLTQITLCQHQEGEVMTIVYADDGVGIPLEAKSTLFQSSFGKNHGFGMFLSGEILTLSGMGINENGSPGSGVRINITVPKGKYRTQGRSDVPDC